MKRLLLPTVVLLASAGCASNPPAPLAGSYADVSPQEVREHGGSGQHVRWGGEIIRVDPGAEATCFEVLGRDLNSAGRPLHHDGEQGRFLACRQGFYDPEVFVRGREITVAGTVDGSERRKVGEYDYLYPRVAADVVYLWPRAPRVSRYYEPYPGWGFYPWSDPFWGPQFWYPPVVVVHRGGGHHSPPHSSPPSGGKK